MIQIEQYKGGDPQPGVLYTDVPEKVYHAWPALGSTNIRWLLDSPAKYRMETEHPTPPTTAMREGSMCHAMTLEPETWDRRWRKKPDCRTTPGKRTYTDMLAECPDAEYLTPAEYIKGYELAKDCAAAVKANEQANAILSAGGWPEVSAVWRIGVPGKAPALCKLRVDWLGADGKVLDLKFLARGTHVGRGFGYYYTDSRLHVQAALYEWGLREAGVPDPHLMFVAVEKSGLHEVVVHEPNGPDVSLAEELIYVAIRRRYDAEESGEWPQPEYTRKVQPVGLALWGYQKELELADEYE